MERRLAVMETHPNSGGMWVGKLGTESEVMEYLRQMAEEGNLAYVGSVIELKDGAEVETEDWLELEDCEAVGVKPRVVTDGHQPQPLPGLERRLAGIESNAYGTKKSALAILGVLTDEEISLTLDEVLQDLLQEGREIQ